MPWWACLLTGLVVGALACYFGLAVYLSGVFRK